MTLRVLANASSARLGGGLSYIVRELAAVERACPDVELTVLAAPWNRQDLAAALRSPVQSAPVPSAAARFLYEQMVVPVRAWRRWDVLYFPGNFSPLLPTGTPVVLTVQNPNYFGAGRSFPHNRSLRRRAKIGLSQLSVRRADRVVVISEALRDQLLADLPQAAGKVVVLPSGAPAWSDLDRLPRGALRPFSYFLSLANDYPHKRLDDLVRGWATAFADEDEPLALVLVGDVRENRRQRQRDLAGRLAARLLHTGPVANRAELRWWVAHAAAMVSVSALEAHPLTPAEAGALGCPLLLSDIAAHREVAGDRARYFPVEDQAAFAVALRDLAVYPPPRQPWTWPVTWEDHGRRLVAVLADAARAR